MSNDLQGVVRGFKETKQSVPQFNMPDADVIVWTLQLERHSETGERLDPIPVEMRGKNFSGFINEGNVIRLYEKSWQGGIVRTKRVYNVTYQENIMAHGGYSGWPGIIGFIVFIIIIVYAIYLFSGGP